MPMMTRGCWIVVADGSGAMVLENAGTAAVPDLRLIDRIETRAVTPHQERSGQNQRSAIEVTDRDHLAETAMIASLMTRLTFAVRQARVPRLAIAAPPHLLGAMRARMDDDLRSRVVVMLPKTLTNHPLEQIVTLVGDALHRAA